MAEGDVSALGLVLSLSLVVVAIALSVREHLRLERDIVVAVLRSVVQLLIVAAGLTLVIDEDTPLIWSWLWVAGIVIFAAATVARRAPAMPGVFSIGLAANAITAAVALGLTFGLGIFPLEGRTLVPIAGMVVGNSMKSCVVRRPAARRAGRRQAPGDRGAARARADRRRRDRARSCASR